jgi:hypothetical protein
MTVSIEIGSLGRNVRGAHIGGLGGELATNGRYVGEPSLASALVEPELQRKLGNGQQRELLG